MLIRYLRLMYHIQYLNERLCFTSKMNNTAINNFTTILEIDLETIVEDVFGAL